MLVYRPILEDDTKGPFSSTLSDALFDILMDLNERHNQNEETVLSDGKLTEIAESLVPLFIPVMQTPGTYSVLHYKVEIQEMTEEQFDTLHEFHGY